MGSYQDIGSMQGKVCFCHQLASDMLFCLQESHLLINTVEVKAAPVVSYAAHVFAPPAVAAVANAAPIVHQVPKEHLHPHHIPGVPVGSLQLAPLQHQLHSWGRSAYSRLVISNLKIKKLISHPFSMALFSNNFFLERKLPNQKIFKIRTPPDVNKK